MIPSHYNFRYCRNFLTVKHKPSYNPNNSELKGLGLNKSKSVMRTTQEHKRAKNESRYKF